MPKRKKPAKKAEPKDSAGISKPSLAIEIDPDFLAQLRKLPKPVRRRVGLAIEGVRAHWGKPHHHGGVGIRRLAAHLYESRVRHLSPIPPRKRTTIPAGRGIMNGQGKVSGGQSANFFPSLIFDLIHPEAGLRGPKAEKVG